MSRSVFFTSVVVIFSMSFFSCRQAAEKPVIHIPTLAWLLANSLDSIAPVTARNEIRSVISRAACVSPRGKYTTLVKADTTGYIYFRQDYAYRPGPFEAETGSDSIGTEKGGTGNALPREAVHMIRSHAFHYLLLYPERFFHGWGVPDTVSWEGNLYYRITACDFLEKPVTILFGVQTGRIASLGFPDPEDSAGKISIRFSDWKKTGKYRLPWHIDIDQSGKLYTFDFTGIIINDPGFVQ